MKRVEQTGKIACFRVRVAVGLCQVVGGDVGEEVEQTQCGRMQHVQHLGVQIGTYMAITYIYSTTAKP